MSEVEYECSLCGTDVPPTGAPKGCEICHGGAQLQERAYTLSAHRSGQAPKENRYGPDADLRPRTSPLVVGGVVDHPGLRQN